MPALQARVNALLLLLRSVCLPPRLTPRRTVNAALPVTHANDASGHSAHPRWRNQTASQGPAGALGAGQGTTPPTSAGDVRVVLGARSASHVPTCWPARNATLPVRAQPRGNWCTDSRFCYDSYWACASAPSPSRALKTSRAMKVALRALGKPQYTAACRSASTISSRVSPTLSAAPMCTLS